MISQFANYSKALAGFALRSGHPYGGPVSAAIEPTNICNLRCPECACGSGTLNRPAGSMKLHEFRKIVDTMPSSVSDLYLWGQGEPFLTDGFLEMVSYAASRGFRTLTSTNGHFLDDPEAVIESGLNVLIVSLDGADSESYLTYRIGGDFERVISGIKSLSSLKKKLRKGPAIELQYLVTRETLDGISAVSALASQIGADRITFKTLQTLDLADKSQLLPVDSKFSRYRIKSDGTLEPDVYPFLGNRCLRVYYSFQVDWQGNVLPCCFDKDSDYVMGNVFADSVETVWYSDAFTKFRTQLNSGGRTLDMCRNCTEGLKRKTVGF